MAMMTSTFLGLTSSGWMGTTSPSKPPSPSAINDSFESKNVLAIMPLKGFGIIAESSRTSWLGNVAATRSIRGPTIEAFNAPGCFRVSVEWFEHPSSTHVPCY